MSNGSRTTLLVTGLVITPLAFIAVGSFGKASEGSGDAGSSGVARVVTVPEMGYCIEMPKGWESGYETPQPESVRNGCSSHQVRQELSGGVPLSFYAFYKKQGAQEETCNRADYTFVSVIISETQAPNTPVVPRPTRFRPTSGTGVRVVDHDCDERGQIIDFVEEGRTIEVEIGIGRDADSDRVAQVYAMLDNLTLAPAS